MSRPLLVLALIGVLAALCLGVVLFRLIPPADAHSWYAPSCCSGHDCEPIPRDALVEELPDGWHVAFISKNLGPVDLFFPRKLKRDSEDGSYHACIRPADLEPLCIYVPVNV